MKMITIASDFNHTEAQLVRARLEAAGFHPFVANENGPMSLGGFSKATLIRIEVPENEADDAREFLNTPVTPAE